MQSLNHGVHHINTNQEKLDQKNFNRRTDGRIDKVKAIGHSYQYCIEKLDEKNWLMDE